MARQKREAEEARIKAEQAAEAKRIREAQDKVDAERRAVEDAARKEREAEEERQRKARAEEDARKREIERLSNELTDGYEMLATFVRRFGHREEFRAVTKAIGPYLRKVA